jgi:ProP effector
MDEEAMAMTNDQILDLLYERFPKIFARDPAGQRPLKRGIDRELMARLGGTVSRSAIKRALGAYVASPEYRAKLIAGAARLDLDGNPAGAVTAGEAAYALAPKSAKVPPVPPPPASSAPPQPKRLGLDDLRRAARLRKAASGSQG